MKVKENIFGSRPERRLYKALDRSWTDRLRIYPGLPFLSIVDCSGARLTPGERDYLKKTSVDYTACDSTTDHPLISVEFDGLGRGFTRGGRYQEVVGGPDPHRHEKINLKLRLANAVGYPIIVVSYDEAKFISEEDHLTVTHGLIGSYLSHFYTQQRLNEIGPTLDFSGLSEQEKNERIQELIVDAEVEAEFEWNPLVLKEAQAATAARNAGMRQIEEHYLTEPPVPNASADVSLRDSLIAFQMSKRVGTRFTAKGNQLQVSKEVWLRNVEDAFTSSEISRLIAGWLAYREFVDKARQA